ncbi:hypothetical protein GCM10025331_61970 [Actinoplanes utahensis]|uniref:hypothetical protein n=1 Tax=Actinoplanes utahensis TaxID=1869 RepID=UPI000A7B6C44|nr:hypothetical protein Aut01nite_77060 [Actinoplanes utahensis]
MTREIRSRRAEPADRPLYSRALRLRHLAPSGLLCFVFLEGAVVLGLLLALAELVSWWGVLVLPVTVALMVKFNDLVAGALTPRPVARETSAERPTVLRPAAMPAPGVSQPFEGYAHRAPTIDTSGPVPPGVPGAGQSLSGQTGATPQRAGDFRVAVSAAPAAFSGPAGTSPFERDRRFGPDVAPLTGQPGVPSRGAVRAGGFAPVVAHEPAALGYGHTASPGTLPDGYQPDLARDDQAGLAGSHQSDLAGDCRSGLGSAYRSDLAGGHQSGHDHQDDLGSGYQSGLAGGHLSGGFGATPAPGYPTVYASSSAATAQSYAEESGATAATGGYSYVASNMASEHAYTGGGTVGSHFNAENSSRPFAEGVADGHPYADGEVAGGGFHGGGGSAGGRSYPEGAAAGGHAYAGTEVAGGRPHPEGEAAESHPYSDGDVTGGHLYEDQARNADVAAARFQARSPGNPTAPDESRPADNSAPSRRPWADQLDVREQIARQAAARRYE